MSRPLGFANFDRTDDFVSIHRYIQPTAQSFEDDPAASALRRRFRHLGMAVIRRAINDAAGIDVVAADHSWVTEENGRRVLEPWLRDECAGMTATARAAHIRRLMIADARTFLLSDEREQERAVWFRCAGVDYPGRRRMKAAIDARRAMADGVVRKMRRRGTSYAAASSPASTSSRPRSSKR